MSLQLKNDCSDPSELRNIQMGRPFVICVVSNPAPAVQISGFATEVLFSSGLKWLQRPSCTDEVQMARQDGGPLAACQSYLTLALGGVGHIVLSEFGPLPLAALTVAPASTTALVELDFSCNAVGSYKLTLTAKPDSLFGAIYGDLTADEIFVKTVPQDYDGNTLPNQVASTLTITCEEFVGGIAELPEVAGTPLEAAGLSSAGGSPFASVAGAVAAGTLALTSAVWYARRRLVR